MREGPIGAHPKTAHLIHQERGGIQLSLPQATTGPPLHNTAIASLFDVIDVTMHFSSLSSTALVSPPPAAPQAVSKGTNLIFSQHTSPSRRVQEQIVPPNALPAYEMVRHHPSQHASFPSPITALTGAAALIAHRIRSHIPLLTH